VKKRVAVERARAAQDLYEKLETREGKKTIHRLARSRDEMTKDNFHCYVVKAKGGTILNYV